MFKITLRVKFIIGLLLFLGFTNLLTSENSKGKSSFDFIKIALFEAFASDELPVKDFVTEESVKKPDESERFTKTPSASVPVIKVENIEDISCFAQSDGSIEVSVSGGSGPYTYSWSLESGTFVSTSQNISGLSKGNYILVGSAAASAQLCGPARPAPAGLISK